MDLNIAAQVESVRQFNRFFTQRIGVLDESLLASAFTLTQARVLFEIGTRKIYTAGDLIAVLGLDPGYLSRILQEFADSKLVLRRQSVDDGRRTNLSLTRKGQKAFDELDHRSRLSIGELINPLSASKRARLIEVGRFCERLLPRAPRDASQPSRSDPMELAMSDGPLSDTGNCTLKNTAGTRSSKPSLPSSLRNLPTSMIL